MNKIGIIGAMQVEINHLHTIMKDCKEIKIGNLVFYEGKIGKTNIVLVKSGVGKVNAAMVTTILIITFKVTHLINTGVAGGMSKDLSIFDIVVSTDVIHHDMNAVGFGYKICEVPGLDTISFPADKKMIELAKEAYKEGSFDKKIKEGRVASGDVFVSTAEAKAKIVDICNPVCCEMEGAAVAQVAYLNKVPFIIIRAISDMAENTDEVYEEEKAAKYSGFLVEHLLKKLGN
ncbi:MAG: 5'-nucleosidase [Treponema sp. CETP13]|nr:MAG: 5'-nucleosidase [Treponema sp. CETP13]